MHLIHIGRRPQMKTYIVTVHYALRIEAKTQDEAQQIAETITRPGTAILNAEYVPNSWVIPDIHEAQNR